MGNRAHLHLALAAVLAAAVAPCSVAAAELRLRPSSELTFFILNQGNPPLFLPPNTARVWAQPRELAIGPAAHRTMWFGSQSFSDPAARGQAYSRLLAGRFHFHRFRLSGISTGAPIALAAFEIGSRNRFLGNRLMINADVFGYRTARYKLPAPFSSLRPFSRTTGAELEVGYKLTSTDRASLNLSYSNVRKPAASSLLNVRLANSQTSKIMALQIMPTYEHILPLPNGRSLEFDAAAIYRSSARITNLIGSLEPFVRKSNSTQFDVSMTYKFEPRLSMAAYIRNLTDVRPDRSMTLTARNNFNPATVSAVLSEPRTFGLQLAAQF